MNGQGAPGRISVQQIRDRLCCIGRMEHTRWIRSYASSSGLENIPRKARKFGYDVAMGVWIRSDTKDQESDHLVEAARNGWGDIAFVGNDEVFAGALSPDELAAEVADARARLDAKHWPVILGTMPDPFATLFARGC